MKLRHGNLVTGLHPGIKNTCAIIQQVNAQGVMGSGIAKEIRETWPKVWDEYSATVGAAYTQGDSGLKHMGRVIITDVEPELMVISIVGQQFFGRDGSRYTSYDALDKGFAEIADLLGGLDVKFHHPFIGCGLGGGIWQVISSIIEEHLGSDTTLWMLP
jgi:O-acetyl-ADP-ribose deacetylase (regulator of RNase III)